MGLTNWHVVRPVLQGFLMESEPLLGSYLEKCDKEGLYPNDRLRQIPNVEIEHPSRLRHNLCVVAHNEQFRQYPSTAEDKERLANWITFFDEGKQALGRIWLGSGFAHRIGPITRLSRQDWALIEPMDESRVGSNKLPTKAEWAEKYWLEHPDAPTFDGTLKNQGESLNENQNLQVAYKCGASTKHTMGESARTWSLVLVSLMIRICGLVMENTIRRWSTHSSGCPSGAHSWALTHRSLLKETLDLLSLTEWVVRWECCLLEALPSRAIGVLLL